MTKEQEEAIEYLKKYRYENEVKDAINIVLSMLEEKDKVIDLMASAICYEPLPTDEFCIFRNIDCPIVGGNRCCRDCVKQYFENKAKEVE